MHRNEIDRRAHLARTGSELDFFVGLNTLIPCSSKCFNVARERRETTLFYYIHVNVVANVN